MRAMRVDRSCTSAMAAGHTSTSSPGIAPGNAQEEEGLELGDGDDDNAVSVVDICHSRDAPWSSLEMLSLLKAEAEEAEGGGVVTEVVEAVEAVVDAGVVEEEEAEEEVEDEGRKASFSSARHTDGSKEKA